MDGIYIKIKVISICQQFIRTYPRLPGLRKWRRRVIRSGVTWQS